jgi:hypothetical protein
MSNDIRKAIKQIVSEVKFSSSKSTYVISDKFIEIYSNFVKDVDGWMNVNDAYELSSEIPEFDGNFIFKWGKADDSTMYYGAGFYWFNAVGDNRPIEPGTSADSLIDSLVDHFDIDKDDVVTKLLELGWII